MSSKNHEIKEYLLGDICEIINGKTFNADEYTISGLPVLKVESIQDGKINPEKLFYCNPEKNKSSPFIQNGDIIMSKYGSTGSAGKIGINLTNLKIIFPSNIYKFLLNEKIINKRYFYHFLLSSESQIRNFVIGAAIPRINKSDLQKIRISLPSLKEQEKIAMRLDILNELKNELKLRERQYRYYRDYLINNPGGAVKEYLLVDVCEIISGTSFKESDYTKTGTPVLKVKDIQDGVVKTENLFYCNLEQFPNASQINSEDLIFAKDGSGAGRIAINFNDQTFLHDSHVVKIVPKSTCLKKYIFHYINGFEKHLKNLATVGIIPGIRFSDLRSFKLWLPSLKVQQNIANKLDAFAGSNSGIISLLQNKVEQVQQAYEWCREFLLVNQKS